MEDSNYSEPEELIRITVDLGVGKEPDSIVVFVGQEEMTHHLAHQFCLKHGFDRKIEDALFSQIVHNIQIVKD